MTRIRTYNNRAKRLPYPVFKARMREAQKIARFATMYGMGPRKFREAMQPYPCRPLVFVATNYAEQERRALEWHRASLDAARARGDIVIEHSYADATIISKDNNDDK